MPEQHLPTAAVPEYNEVIDRNDISFLQTPGDWKIVDGDLATTRRGDIMVNSPEYSALFRLVNWWRFNYPVMHVMFHAVFPSAADRERLEGELETLFKDASKKSPHPMNSSDYDEFHRINDAMGAEEVARGVYAGAIVIAMSNALQSLRADLEATSAEWDEAVPRYGSCSFGQVIVASANNVRHADEWATTAAPTRQQLLSMRVLSLALDEPLYPPNGSQHRFGREVSPEILQVICNGDMAALERAFFAFAKDMHLLIRARKLFDTPP
ncbi:hypothetical protein SBC1_02770 [Caballeronia sp. SBC1]|uniref:hypothetical protein n=1 Tax=Caballeronia sp. SBC1 TaxID=2705548 RepID=UPI001407CB7E|nr:hypothetical protein [Caballeronia sp. SBC1]QIN60302.1 hypothetical protein SBC1_02770 [Caballeronia sp. SBC1]